VSDSPVNDSRILACQATHRCNSLDGQELRTWKWQVTCMPQGCWLASFDRNEYHNDLKSHHVSHIIRANLYGAEIRANLFHDCHTWSPITATMAFTKTTISIINLNIVNSEHSPSSMIMTDVIKKNPLPKTEQNHVQKTPNYHPSIHPPKCEKIPTSKENPWTTVQPVHSILTTTN